MENVIELTSAIAEILDQDTGSTYAHPLLTKIKFVFATDEGARLSTSRPGLKQGIKYEDFDTVIQSAVNTPIKMRYLGGSTGVGSHSGSIPIGHITDMQKAVIDGVNSLVAEAVLYTYEFPDEVKFLKEAFANNESPGISYEIRHNPDKSIIENGVEWLKEMITQAATIVKSPAYGTRTAIMALASNKEISGEEFNKEVLSILVPKTDKGGLKMEEDKIKIAELEASILAKASEIAGLTTKVEETTAELEAKAAELQKVSEENATLKEAALAAAKEALASARVQAYTDAGLSFDEDAKLAAEKKETLVNMSEDIFNMYINDLKTAKTKVAAASSRGGGLGFPKLTETVKDNSTLNDLKSGLRAAARGEAPQSE